MNKPDIETQLNELNKMFEDLLDSTTGDIELENQTLKRALKSQTKLQLKWDAMYAAAKRVNEFATKLEEESYSDAVTGLLKDRYKEYSITEAKEIARTDTVYREMRRLRIESSYILEDCKGVKSAVESRRYVLNNLTSSLVAGIDSHIL